MDACAAVRSSRESASEVVFTGPARSTVPRVSPQRLLAGGCSVLDVAAQAGHKASVSLDTYGHLFSDFDASERADPEATIRATREGVVPAAYPAGNSANGLGKGLKLETAHKQRA
jgi:hypothetical protein